MPNPSHIPKDKLADLQNIADWAQVNVSRARLLIEQGEHYLRTIESTIQEEKALNDARGLIRDDKQET